MIPLKHHNNRPNYDVLGVGSRDNNRDPIMVRELFQELMVNDPGLQSYFEDCRRQYASTNNK